MDADRTDLLERAVRFALGFALGAALGAWCALGLADLDSGGAIAACAVVCGSLAGLAAARHGDSFWHRCASALRWWWP